MTGGGGSGGASGPSAGAPQGGPGGAPTPGANAGGSTGSDLEQHLHHTMGSVTPGPGGNGPDSASSTPVSQTGKSAFIELQHNNLYNPGGLRASGYPGSAHNMSGAHQFSQHVGGLAGHQPGQPGGGQQQHGALGYPFAPMHQHNYGYHLGSYAPQCPSPPKDGEYPNCTYGVLPFSYS